MGTAALGPLRFGSVFRGDKQPQLLLGDGRRASGSYSASEIDAGRIHAHAYLWNRRHASAQSQQAAVLLRRVKVLGGKVPAASQRRLVCEGNGDSERRNSSRRSSCEFAGRR